MRSNFKQGGRSVSRGSVTIGILTAIALEAEKEAKRAGTVLRTTYLKKRYLKVWPDDVLGRLPRPPSVEIKDKRYDFVFQANERSRCFVRNLWALDQFFAKPSKVLEFFGNNAKHQERMFRERCKELKVLEVIYRRWPALEERVVKLLGSFDPRQDDLYSLIRSEQSPTSQAEPTGITLSPAIADRIRQLEQHPAYREGNPASVAEKALCYLELGCEDIARRIASEVLQEHPDHPAALYVNSVLMLAARRKNLERAAMHELMHPGDLEPITAEEQAHYYGQQMEVSEAWQRENDAFELLLKAWVNWPDSLPIQSFAMHPVVWKEQVQTTVLQMAARKLINGAGSRTCGVDGKPELTRQLQSCLKGLVEDLPRLLRFASDCRVLLDFLVVTAHIAHREGQRCLDWVEKKLTPGSRKSKGSKKPSGYEPALQGSPTFAEHLAELRTDELFVSSLILLKGPRKAMELCDRIEARALIDRTQRLASRLLKNRFIFKPLHLAALVCSSYT